MSFERGLEKLSKAIFALLMISVCLMLVIGTMQVFFRYVLGRALSWSEEAMRYLNIWSIFLGVSIGIPRGLHVAIEAFVQRLGGQARRAVTLLIQGLSIVFFALITVIGARFASYNVGQVSPAMRLPLSLVYISIPTGGALSLLFVIGEVLKSIKGGETR